MSFAELLDVGLQLPGDVVNYVVTWILEVQSTSLAPTDEFELWSRSWHSAIDDREGSQSSD